MFHGGHRIPAESFDILIQFLVGVFQEMFHVSRQVAVPFPQGRHSQHEFIKSVVQVFPKPSGRNGRFEIFVGGNDGINTEIKKGITAQERIVTRGAMLIKLAQATGGLDAHSGHVH